LSTYFSTGPQPLTPGNYYPLSDLLYRSAALTSTDDSANVVEAYDTDAYGNTLLFSGPGTDGLWFTDDDVQAAYPACRFVFTGREYDTETSLYFYRARYYHPQLGRFVSRDPIVYGDVPNLYSYTLGCPTSSLDPLGLESVTLGSLSSQAKELATTILNQIRSLLDRGLSTANDCECKKRLAHPFDPIQATLSFIVQQHWITIGGGTRVGHRGFSTRIPDGSGWPADLDLSVFVSVNLAGDDGGKIRATVTANKQHLTFHRLFLSVHPRVFELFIQDQTCNDNEFKKCCHTFARAYGTVLGFGVSTSGDQSYKEPCACLSIKDLVLGGVGGIGLTAEDIADLIDSVFSFS